MERVSTEYGTSISDDLRNQAKNGGSAAGRYEYGTSIDRVWHEYAAGVHRGAQRGVKFDRGGVCGYTEFVMKKFAVVLMMAVLCFSMVFGLVGCASGQSAIDNEVNADAMNADKAVSPRKFIPIRMTSVSSSL